MTMPASPAGPGVSEPSKCELVAYSSGSRLPSTIRTKRCRAIGCDSNDLDVLDFRTDKTVDLLPAPMAL